jgi:hypothetical protein
MVKRWSLSATRAVVVVINAGLVGIAVALVTGTQKVGVLELFLMANLLCCTSAFPVLFGLSERLHPLYGGASFLASCLFSIVCTCGERRGGGGGCCLLCPPCCLPSPARHCLPASATPHPPPSFPPHSHSPPLPTIIPHLPIVIPQSTASTTTTSTTRSSSRRPPTPPSTPPRAPTPTSPAASTPRAPSAPPCSTPGSATATSGSSSS